MNNFKIILNIIFATLFFQLSSCGLKVVENHGQVYEKNIAKSLYDNLLDLLETSKIADLKLIDSNPQNNPQPPQRKKED